MKAEATVDLSQCEKRGLQGHELVDIERTSYCTAENAGGVCNVEREDAFSVKDK